MKTTKIIFALIAMLFSTLTMSAATKYCGDQVQSTVDNKSVSIGVTILKVGDVLRVSFESEHISGIRAGGTFQQWGNGVWANQDDAVANFKDGWTQNGTIWTKDFAFSKYPTSGTGQIYCLFDIVNAGTPPVAGFTLTDIDLLDFVSSWLSNDNKARPKNLCNELKDKYLLMLGNTYSDWLFRFIWYSMRKPDLGHGMLAYDTLDESLINFLERTETFTKQNTSDVIDQILVRLDKKLKENEATKFNKPEENMDVFISYSRSDTQVAEQLYKALTAQGKRVWYDKYNLTDGGLFMDEIRKAIKTAKY